MTMETHTTASWWSKTLLALGGLALILLLVGPLGSRFGVWDWTLALGNARNYFYGVVVVIVLSIIAIIIASVKKRSQDRLLSIIALVMLLIPTGILLNQASQVRDLPLIHDISTDTVNPPRFVEVLALRGQDSNPVDYTDPEVPKQQQAGYPDVKSLLTQLPKEEAFNKALVIINDYGWDIVSEDKNAGRIEATATTFWFGFKDDVVLRIVAEGDGSVVDLRSVSRVGRSDVGANAARILRFLQDFEQS